MHRLVALLIVCAWVSSIFAGLDETQRNKERLKMCTSRNTTDYVDGCDDAFYTMYIYNETTGECEQLPESICYRSAMYGVYFTYLDCTHSCAKGKAPTYCSAEPYEPANDTCTVKERSWYDHGNSCDPNVAYYYKPSLEDCVPYNTCKDPWRIPQGSNGYARPYFCEKECRGFTAEMTNGALSGSGTVNCTGEPIARCDGENRGRARYFYNASSRTCEEYEACLGGWPKGLSRFNYFVTNRSCELECGDYDASKYKDEASARDDLGDEYYVQIY